MSSVNKIYASILSVLIIPDPFVSLIYGKRGWLCTLLVLSREAVLVLEADNIEQPGIAVEEGEDGEDHDEKGGKSVELCPQDGHHGHVAHEAVEGGGPGGRTAEEQGEVVGQGELQTHEELGVDQQGTRERHARALGWGGEGREESG